jgi:hypothetical protein
MYASGARCTLSNSYSGRIVSRIRDDLGALSGHGQQTNNYSPRILVSGVRPWLQERGHPPSEPAVASGPDWDEQQTKAEVNEDIRVSAHDAGPLVPIFSFHRTCVIDGGSLLIAQLFYN